MSGTSHMGGESRIRHPKQGAACLSWVLMLMGLGTLAPCVILPEWRQCEILEMAVQMEQHRLDALERQVERERRLLDAVRSDPAVIARLAQRELGFRRVDRKSVLVSAPATITTAEPPLALEPPRLPPIIAGSLSLLPKYDYDRVFCDDETRPIILCMSVALIGVAMGLGRENGTGPVN